MARQFPGVCLYQTAYLYFPYPHQRTGSTITSYLIDAGRRWPGDLKSVSLADWVGIDLQLTQRPIPCFHQFIHTAVPSPDSPANFTGKTSVKAAIVLAFCTACLTQALDAQTSRITYTTLAKLNAGEQVDHLLSCWQPDTGKGPSILVIQEPGNTYATIIDGIRKDHLTREQVMSVRTCQPDHFAPPKNVYIKPAGLQLPPSTNVLFLREAGPRYVAVVATEKKEYFFLDSENRKTKLNGRPADLITNSDLTRCAVVLVDDQQPSVQQVNKMAKNDQVAFFEKMRTTDLTRRVWLNDGATFTVQKKSRLLFDMSGRHFIEIQPKVFYIDGSPVQRDISGGGTQLFVSPDGKDWAYFYMVYLGFKNNTNLNDVFHPFITSENGKEYLNWFIVQKEGGSYVVRQGQRAW